MSSPRDTIAALCTPPGEAGLAVIRVSGPKALAVADRCFEPLGRSHWRPSDCPSHRLLYGRILHEGRTADEVLLAVFRKPHSYTGEDTVEISCHGGLLPARMILQALLAAGARHAEPGEFTRRAFLNGRMDLAQAEAVADLIHARTELALAAAQEQLAGALSRRVQAIRDELLQALAHLEAHIDFPEEDIQPDTAEALVKRLRAGQLHIDRLLRTAREGRLLRHGIRAALVGRVNAGKSSLLNRLLGQDRAIVSELPGTTRDTIEEAADIRGLPLVLVDTAGLRQAEHPVEAEGIQRTRRALAAAELILHVVDGSEPFSPEEEAWIQAAPDRPRLLVLNKADLPRRCEPPAIPGLRRTVVVSCLTGKGIEELKDAIREVVWSGTIQTEAVEVAINARHQDALRRARASLDLAAEALAGGLSPELVAVDLRAALAALGEIVGEVTTEELLDSIFNRFCIGK